jgi:hypothetical protein
MKSEFVERRGLFFYRRQAACSRQPGVWGPPGSIRHVAPCDSFHTGLMDLIATGLMDLIAVSLRTDPVTGAEAADPDVSAAGVRRVGQAAELAGTTTVPWRHGLIATIDHHAGRVVLRP